MISILVPVYNAERYLNRCIDSVLAQTYEAFELVIVDDGSTDASARICDGYQQADRRVRVMHTENRGVGAARNLLLDSARGQYIGFVDSDDYIEPDMFEVLIQSLQERNADVAVCGTSIEFATCRRFNSDPHEKRTYSREEAVSALADNWVITSSLWDKLFKAELFTGIRFPEIPAFEDMLIVFRLLERCAAVAFDGRPLYHHFKSAGSLMCRRFNEGHLAELHAREEMLENVGAVYPALRPKLHMAVLKAKLYMCNRIVTESPEFKSVYQELCADIRKAFKTIMGSPYAGRNMKLMAALMKINGTLYRACVKLMKKLKNVRYH